MKRTYTITSGQRYDRGGATVITDGNYIYYRADGSRQCGSTPAGDDWDAVAEAVARVIATGETETLTLGEDAPRYTAEQVARIRRLDARMHQWEQTDI